MLCFGKPKKLKRHYPREFEEIWMTNEFSDYSKDDLFSCWYQFRNITKGSPDMNLEDFYKLLVSLNVSSIDLHQ